MGYTTSIISIPAQQKRQITMRRKFIIFSLILFLLIFISGSVFFIFLIEQIRYDDIGFELKKTVELERYKLEAAVNSDIAIVLKMVNSHLMRQYFLNPNNIETKRIASEEFDGYQRLLAPNSLFWVNDADKKLYINSEYAYIINPDDSGTYWYNNALYETEKYNFDINHNKYLNVTNVWINAPIFDYDDKPLGVLGAGINLSSFINSVYKSYHGIDELYLFNAAKEVTGARNVDLVVNKIRIDKELGYIGEEVLAEAKSLNKDDVKYFETKDRKFIIAIGFIPALDWHIIAIHHFTAKDALKVNMIILFIAVMTIIFLIFVFFNIFVVKLLEPVYLIIKELNQISSDWELEKQGKNDKKYEFETLGEFLNMTVIDQLTGIYNRRFFDGNMKKIIKSLSRNTDSKLSLLIIDIDFFKKYNDTYGHNAGDECLKKIASVISETITRKEDFAARYGGEEFVVVLPNTSHSGACIIADKLLKKIRECNIPHEKNEAVGFITVSIGGTTGIVKHLQNTSDYIRCADIALYKSKQNGRNQYTFEDFK